MVKVVLVVVVGMHLVLITRTADGQMGIRGNFPWHEMNEYQWFIHVSMCIILHHGYKM